MENNSPLEDVLVLENLGKRFGSFCAIENINLSFRAGEIHALIGENGAGKSTLIKVMTGVYQKSEGRMIWEGREINPQQPADALELGINAVHQEVVLCPHLTVADNIFLGNEAVKRGLVDDQDIVRRAQAILDSLGFRIDAKKVLSTLTIGQQQLVATARSRSRGVRLLVFDEPTAYLTNTETQQLFHQIRELKKQGMTLIYISHRMEEIFELSDRVSILRDGHKIATYQTSEVTEQTLINDMVGRELAGTIHYKESVALGEPLLTAEHCSGDGFEDISLEIRAGQIVGLYGLIGSGRSEFALSLYGRHPLKQGRFQLNGKPFLAKREKQAIDAGIVLIPETRRDQGLCLHLDVLANLNLPTLKQRSNPLTLVNARREKELADKLIDEFGIRTDSPNKIVSTLSGGNQQKVVIGKWVQTNAKLFIFDEPTAGVDVRTKSEIYHYMAGLLHQGAGILLISSYLPEVYDLADVLHVFYHGKLINTYPHRSASHEMILADALGGSMKKY